MQFLQGCDGDDAVIRIPGEGTILAYGGTIPTDGSAGYAEGCLFIKRNGVAGANSYRNEGSLTSSTFVAETAVASDATLGANVFTALQTITQASANAGILASTGYSLTGSNATNMIDLAGTWNTSGTPTALKINITDTASNAASKLIDLQVGAASQFSVNKSGVGTIKALKATSDGVSGVNFSTAGAGGTAKCHTNYIIGWTADTLDGSVQTAFTQNAAGVVEINNGTAGTYRDLKLRAVEMVDGNLVLGTTTGTKIGTATGQKLGFWNATPVVQQVLATGGGATADNIITLLQTLGLCKQS